MGSLASAILDQTGPMLGYAEGLLNGITPENFARMPQGASGVINTNHPAFVYGHLAIYPERIAQMVGIEDLGFATPGTYADLFAAGVECKDDPEATIYPPMDELTTHFFDGYKAVIAKIGELDDAHLGAPHGLDSDFGKKFHNRASMAGFMLGPHTFMHIGQISAWRRCMGLGSVF